MSDRHFELPIIFHPAQQRISESRARFKVMAASRRFGKTEFGMAWSIMQATVPGTKHYIIFPTARQAREILWERMKSFIPYEILRKSNKTELNFRLTNESMIGLRGSDVEKAMRGNKLHSVFFDEAAYQKEYVWTDIIRPQLMDTQGPAIFSSSPGRPWFKRYYKMGQDRRNKEWASWRFSIYDNPHIKPEEIESVKNAPEMTGATWRREYLSEFDDGAEEFEVYPEFLPSKNVFTHGEKFIGHELWPCIVGIDWGLADNTAAIFIHCSPDCRTMVVSAEHIKNNWPIENHAEAIKRIGEGRTIAQGNYTIDKSAFNRKHEGGSPGLVFARNGIVCKPSEGTRGAHDVGINQIKRLLGSDSTPQLFISTRCQNVIDGFKKWEYGKHEPDALAALRYAVYLAVQRRLIDAHQIRDNVIMSAVNTIPGGHDSSQAQARCLRVRQPEDAGWNIEDGCPED